MSLLSDVLATIFARQSRKAPPPPSKQTTEALIEQLLSTQGEISGMTAAAQILDRFAGMDDAAKLAFFDHLAGDLGIDPGRVRAALDAFEEEPSQKNYAAFLATAEPARQELARRLNRVPGATPQLVAMRADLLRLIPRNDPRARIDLDFQHLFASWFNRGFLVLRPISWQSPAYILEKIIAYEAVHAIDSWDDLRRRVEPTDRRCFAFFHPAMPDEPLIFVEVALTRGIPGSVQRLLAEDRQLKPIEIRARKRRPGEEEGGLQCSGRAHARVSRQVAEQRRVETTDLDSHAAERPGNAQRIGHPGGASGS